MKAKPAAENPPKKTPSPIQRKLALVARFIDVLAIFDDEEFLEHIEFMVGAYHRYITNGGLARTRRRQKAGAA